MKFICRSNNFNVVNGHTCHLSCNDRDVIALTYLLCVVGLCASAGRTLLSVPQGPMNQLIRITMYNSEGSLDQMSPFVLL